VANVPENWGHLPLVFSFKVWYNKGRIKEGGIPQYYLKEGNEMKRLTVKEVCQKFGYNPFYVRKLCRSGEWDSIRGERGEFLINPSSVRPKRTPKKQKFLITRTQIVAGMKVDKELWEKIANIVGCDL
jgi:hypothetical protein